MGGTSFAVGSDQVAEVVDGSRVRPGAEVFGGLVPGASRLDPVDELAPIVGGHRRDQVSHLDLLGVAAYVNAMLMENLHFVGHPIGLAEQVAGVAMPGDEPQRPALTGATNRDRDPVLDRSRVAQELRRGIDPPVERW